jgi:hypothetical protein
MEPLDEMLRASGQYGPRVDVPPDADEQKAHRLHRPSAVTGRLPRQPSRTPLRPRRRRDPVVGPRSAGAAALLRTGPRRSTRYRPAGAGSARRRDEGSARGGRGGRGSRR